MREVGLDAARRRGPSSWSAAKRLARGSRAASLGGFLLAAVVLVPSLSGRSTFLPADLWMYSVPFSLSAADSQRHRPRNPLLTDPAFLYAPQLAVVHGALRAGTFPLWNRFLRGGEPLLGTGESGPLEPLNLPILVLPWPLGFAWAAWLRFGLMWLGAYLFARRLRLGVPWASTVAIAFCFAPGFLVHFEQQPRANAYVGLPWLLFCVERIDVAMRRSPRAAIRAALAIAPIEFLVAIAGYPPAAFIVNLAAVTYLLLRLPFRPVREAILARVVGLGAFGLGLAMSAPGLMPFLEFLRGSATFQGHELAGQWILPSEALRLYWNPYALGSPLTGAARPWVGSTSFEEEQQYIGVLPWVFLLGSICVRSWRYGNDVRRALPLAGLALLSASLAFGWQPVHRWLTSMPPFSSNSNPRMLFLTQTSVVVLAALAARGWLAGRRPPRPRAFALLAVATGVGAMATLALGIAGLWPLRAFVALGAAVALFAAGAVAASAGERRLAGALVPILLLLDVAPVYRSYFPQPPREWADPARAVANLPPPLREDREPRAAFERFTASNLPAVFGVEDVRGYGYPVPLRYAAYMEDVLAVENSETFFREDLERPAVITGIERTCARWLMTSIDYGAGRADALELAWSRKPIYLYRLRRASPCAAWYPDGEVTEASDLPDSIARFRRSLDQQPERIFVERARAPSEATSEPSPGVPAEWRWQGPQQIEVEVPEAARARDGWLVLRVSYDEGWSAVSDRGAPLEVVPAQVRFLAVATQAGTERIVLRYWPPHLSAWLALGAAGLLATAAVWYGSRPRRPPRPGRGAA